MLYPNQGQPQHTTNTKFCRWEGKLFYRLMSLELSTHFFFSIFHKCLESEFHACLALPLMTELMNFTFSLGFVFFFFFFFPNALAPVTLSACLRVTFTQHVHAKREIISINALTFKLLKNNKTLYSNKMSMCKTDRVMR